MEPDADLKRTQEFFFAAVTHRDGMEAGLDSAEAARAAQGRDVDEIIRPSATLEPRERLRIYADMYHWRLVDVLAEDFARCLQVLGRPAFEELARDYLAAHPSRHPNLAPLGDHLPAFIATRDETLAERNFLAALASVELAVSRSFDAEEEPGLDATALFALDPEDWPELRISLRATTHVLELSHPIDAWLDAGGDPQRLPAPKRSWLLIFRQNLEVLRLPLEASAGTLLRSLASGETLATALDRAASLEAEGSAALIPKLERWFRHWTSLGCLSPSSL